MSQNNLKIYAALVIASVALALSIRTAVRAPSDASAGSGACVDREARDLADRLRRALAERDAFVARLAQAVNVPGAPLAAADPAGRLAAQADQAPRRYTRFETSNAAVTMTQKDDGTYDIRTTDPTLAGSVLQVTAISESGEEEKLMIRIPE